MKNFDYTTAQAIEIADRIRSASTWNPEDLEELCTLADMKKEWNEADGETFERVVYAAAQKLHVDID